LANLLRRCRHLDERAGHVLEGGDQIDLLLEVPPDRSARLLSDDRQDRLMI
jgi:hypothetical protein